MNSRVLLKGSSRETYRAKATDITCENITQITNNCFTNSDITY